VTLAPREYWPFDVPPLAQQTEEDRKWIRFMERAFAEGFRPCRFLPHDFGCESPNGRVGFLTHRGRFVHHGPVQWEVWLGMGPTRVAGFWTDEFDSAADAVLCWVRGCDVDSVIQAAKSHITRGPHVAIPEGTTAHSERA
jgi:hypothetical protein